MGQQFFINPPLSGYHRSKRNSKTEEGKELLKEWNIPENYVGIGHCILGYPEEKSEAKPRKEDYIRFIK